MYSTKFASTKFAKCKFCIVLNLHKQILLKLIFRKRIQFARRYLHWTADDWGRVLWTDESSFQLNKFYRYVNANLVFTKFVFTKFATTINF